MPLYKYCRHCGEQLTQGAAFCSKCGAPAGKGNHYCWNCGKPTEGEAVVCVSCGVQLRPMNGSYSHTNADPESKSKIAAGLFGIFLGCLGIHNFYLGYSGKAAAQLVLAILGIFTFGITTWISGIWGFIEGILILVGNIKTDANGRPLRD
jgi:TM2 domain-containing membrane protein YozV